LARWIDKSDEHRLVVHDWHEHCDDATHIKLARAVETFATGQVPNMARMKKEERTVLEVKYAQQAHTKRTRSAPKAQAMPSQAMPSQASIPSGALEEEKTDPLASFPILSAFIAKLKEFILHEHPKTRAFENPEKDGLGVLEKLVRLDKFREQEIVDVLTWCFTAEVQDAHFWRQQVQGLSGLRKCKDGELSKFGKIHDKWLHRNSQFQKAPTPIPDGIQNYPESADLSIGSEKRRLKREAAERAAKEQAS
jgi:hypothetical protein